MNFMRYSHGAYPWLTWNVNHPFVQCIHAVHLTCTPVTKQLPWFSDWLAQHCSTCVQIIIALLNNGTKPKIGDAIVQRSQ